MLRWLPKRGRRLAALSARADRARDAARWPEAAALYAACLACAPNRAGLWVQMGNCLKEAMRRGEAEDAYRAALALAPAEADTHLQLAHLLKITARETEALAHYRKAEALGDASGQAGREADALKREFNGRWWESGDSANASLKPEP